MQKILCKIYPQGNNMQYYRQIKFGRNFVFISAIINLSQQCDSLSIEFVEMLSASFRKA